MFNQAIQHHYHEQMTSSHVSSYILFCMRKCFLLLAIVVAFGGLQASSQVAYAQEGVVPAAAALNEAATSEASRHTDAAQPGRYQIGAGDMLDVRILNRPQLSRESVRVDQRGTIQMPWIDKEVQAACRTERELAEELTVLYRRFLRNPQVDVFIKEYQSKPIAVIGAVNTPGRFQLQRSLRLLELLTYVNGPAERAGRTIQIIHANDAPICGSPVEDDSDADADDVGDVTSLALGEVLRGEPDANPYVRAGDIITVLEAELVFVIGNVIKPTQIPLRDTLTVSQAVAMAGGLAPDAKSDKIRIIRQLPDAKKSIFFVDFKAIDKGQAADIALQANDILDIPSSNTRGKQIGKAILSSFFPSVGSLPVRVIR